tara:strand:+ start:4858 stop:5886 length:1029 start_codon:yes stop_codon:yes gene_type:complete
MTENNILVTGAAGFIGAALVKRFLDDGSRVIGIDDLNNYYDVSLKKKRLDLISEKKRKTNGEWFFYERSIENFDDLDSIAKNFKINIVINLAAQAGVRYSLQNPKKYIDSNLVGFGNVLELCRKYQIENFIYASSSSVYGGNMNYPFRETSLVEHPVSLYAATKKANEAMAHSYSHLFNIPSTGLRFFTVYGPWGRPDMAPMIFARSILNREPIHVFNNGDMARDFTFIDDIVEGIFLCSKKPATIDLNFDKKNPNPSTSFAPHRIFNIGNNKPVKLLHFIEILEDKLGVKAEKIYKPMQPGDVKYTYADTSKLKNWVGYKSSTAIEIGIEKFAKWHKEFYD